MQEVANATSSQRQLAQHRQPNNHNAGELLILVFVESWLR